MPPALSEDEASAAESDIPYKEVDKNTKKEQPAEDEDEDSEEEEDPDRFTVDKVLSHIFDDTDKEVKYEIMWMGFPKFEDRTWEPRENLLERNEPILQLQEYWEKECGGVEPKFPKTTKNGPGGKKRKLDQSAQSTPATKEPKGRRKSARGQEAEAKPKEEAPLPTKEKESGTLPPGSWETQIASIDTIVQEPHEKTGTLEIFAYISWADGSKNCRTKHPVTLLKKKCPQKLIEYFVQHLVFHSPRTSPEANGDADLSGMLKSDIVMDMDD